MILQQKTWRVVRVEVGPEIFFIIINNQKYISLYITSLQLEKQSNYSAIHWKNDCKQFTANMGKIFYIEEYEYKKY